MCTTYFFIAGLDAPEHVKIAIPLAFAFLLGKPLIQVHPYIFNTCTQYFCMAVCNATAIQSSGDNIQASLVNSTITLLLWSSTATTEFHESLCTPYHTYIDFEQGTSDKNRQKALHTVILNQHPWVT